MLIIADSKIVNAESAFSIFGEVRTFRTSEIVNANIKDADVLLVRSETPVNSAVLDGTRIQFVGTATIGTDHVDAEYLNRQNIRFASCPGSNANSVAEYVLSALLEVGAKFNLSLKAKTLGVVGHGNTGSRVAIKAEAIGMRVLLNDPPLQRASGDKRYCSLDELMNADFISLHVPLARSGIDATYHLFDEKRIAAMKKGSVLVNASRGAVVETQGLKNALQSEHLLACVLDVWEGEPNIDIELLKLVAFGSPHIAGYSYDGKLNATVMLQRAVAEAFGFSLAISESSDSALKEVTVPRSLGDVEADLLQVLRQCYDIQLDDKNVRQLCDLELVDRAEGFKRLRATYRTRREFSNYVLDSARLNNELRSMLSCVGFIIK